MRTMLDGTYIIVIVMLALLRYSIIGHRIYSFIENLDDSAIRHLKEKFQVTIVIIIIVVVIIIIIVAGCYYYCCCCCHYYFFYHYYL